MLDRNQGSLEFALAAYNGGEGAMQRLAARQPDASFWNPRIYNALSPETRDYVPMVLAAAWLFLHPERYHLTFPKLSTKATTIALKKSGNSQSHADESDRNQRQ